MRNESLRSLPLWGPYSKKYMGLSRVMDESRIDGARFDLVVYPTYANSAVPVPNVTVPSDYHPWKVDPEGKFYRYRYELQWKDQLYADIDFFEVDADTWGVRVEYRNQTSQMQNCLLNLFAAIEYPCSTVWEAELPDQADRWKATDFETLSLAGRRPWDHLNFDGMPRGVQLRDDFTEGTALTETFYARWMAGQQYKMLGGSPGDRLVYRRTLRHTYRRPVLTVRYATYEPEEDIVFDTNHGVMTFPASTATRTVSFPLEALEDTGFVLEMTARGAEKNGLMVDCFVLTEADQAGKVTFQKVKRNVVPAIQQENGRVKYQYHYGEPPVWLGILNSRVRSRKLYSGCLEDALITRLTNSDASYDNLTRSFSGAFRDKHSDEGFYHINVVEAIFLPGQSSQVQYAYLSTLDRTRTAKELEQAWQVRRLAAEEPGLNPEGAAYDFSAGLMRNALFSNVVYPIYRHGKPIIHYTPGKRWDSLYTWDSGFIGLGLLEFSDKRAEYVLDTYLSEPDNQDFAFLAHGSLVPTQFYLWYELMQRADDARRAQLKQYYPMLLRYYRFMAGKSEGSSMNRLGSGMLTVYDYFYNAGGMDDYPPQVAMHRQHLDDRLAPVCSSVHFIRIAKIMAQTARYYGFAADVQEMEEDIRRVSRALLDNAWDPESGYFGYVLHNPDGTEIFRTPEGENYNKGVDGVTPLIAGVCTPAQEERMLDHLKTEGELWSSVGISTVDQTASYYNDNGYWNGSVWFPYQYLLWKSMLDVGDVDFAWQIAHTALSAWKQEADFSYNSFEMIQIETGRGGWFHQFSGLSAPISVWYHAYYKQGTVTTGYGTWIASRSFSPESDQAQICFDVYEKRGNQMIVVMNSAYSYTVELYIPSAQAPLPVRWTEHVKGALEIPLPAGRGEIRIRRQE